MWQPLSKLLNFFGKIPFVFKPSRVSLTVGQPDGRDARFSEDWKNYLRPEPLYENWGPVPGSTWEHYHCVPLFAALQTIPDNQTGPTHLNMVRQIEGNGHLTDELMKVPLGEGWASRQSWVILDIPGPSAVAVSVRMIAAGFQPVCTFDHWPHPQGLIKSEIILAQLLRYASSVQRLRDQLKMESPPLWICDRNRLGTRRGTPNQFDNRYFLDDSILPSADVLRRAGIQHIICMVPGPSDQPTDDLRAYFRDLRKDNFAQITGVALSDSSLELFSFPEDTFTIDFKQRGFSRSDAGGFGQLIPQPSSSSG